MVDLHLHSTASDGSVPPADLPAMGARVGLRALALTDHDTLAGLPAFLDAAREVGIEAVGGIELSTRFEFAEIHIIGYNPDPRNEALLSALGGMQGSRAARNAKILERLSDMGFPLDLAEVEAFAGDRKTVGRPHFARAMVARGYVHDVPEAFARFLGDGGPAVVPRERIETVDGIRLLREAGAIVVWAHPRVGFSSESFHKILPKLMAAGLDGLEAYHSNQTNTKTRDVFRAARDNNLLVTGGSDFHGACKPDISLGRGTGNLRVPNECWTHLKERLHR